MEMYFVGYECGICVAPTPPFRDLSTKGNYGFSDEKCGCGGGDMEL